MWEGQMCRLSIFVPVGSEICATWGACVAYSCVDRPPRFGGRGPWRAAPAGAARASQCGTFTGMIPVYGVLLILFEWYWYMVCESGIRT